MKLFLKVNRLKSGSIKLAQSKGTFSFILKLPKVGKICYYTPTNRGQTPFSDNYLQLHLSKVSYLQYSIKLYMTLSLFLIQNKNEAKKSHLSTPIEHLFRVCRDNSAQQKDFM